MKQVSVAMASFLFLAQLEVSAEAALKIQHDGNEPARVEVQDLDNPQVINRFYLNKGQSKVVDVVGLKCKVKVFAKGSDSLKVEGEVSPNQNLSIQPSGGSWVLKRVSR